MVCKKIKIGSKTITAISLKLLKKTLIVLRGRRGYIMCGYLDLSAANKFNDAAIKITGVSNLTQALTARVFAASQQARKLGIYKGQPIKEAPKIIA